MALLFYVLRQVLWNVVNASCVCVCVCAFIVTYSTVLQKCFRRIIPLSMLFEI